MSWVELGCYVRGGAGRCGCLRAGARRFLGALLCSALVGCANERRAPTASEVVRLDAPAVATNDAVCGSLPAGVSEHRLMSGGIERRFLVYLPRGAAPAAGWPLVFNLHGSGATPEGQLATSGLATLADARRFAILAPAAVGAERRWNVPPAPDKADDVRFVSELIDTASRAFCVDERRVYATGFSGGARMSSQLACDLSARIGAIAAIGGVRFPGPCASARSIPVLAFHGTADPTNPFDGGGAPYWGSGVEDAVRGWARHNGCPGPNVRRVAAAVSAESYAGDGCGDVVLYRIEGFGHAWPGSIADDPEHASANEILWRFFETHPLPE